MSDEFTIPRVPEPKPDDPEDVSWALSTAEAMWARGDHADGIKWVRKAAEAASDAEDDMRALELAKAASELAAAIAKQSQRNVGSAAPPPAASSAAPPAPGHPAAPSSAPRSVPPRASKPPTKVAASPLTPSPPPIPRATGSSKSLPPAPRSVPPARPSAPPRPLSATSKPQGPAPGKGILSNRPPPDKRARRRSRENLDAEAQAAATLLSTAETAKHPVLDAAAASRALAEAARDSDTATTKREPVSTPRTVEEWDASPTLTVSAAQLGAPTDGDRTTVSGMGVATIPKPVHDGRVPTSQAVRVLVWRDVNGVHVAPAGTLVGAITCEAMLVALDPSTDLTAWLSRKGT